MSEAPDGTIESRLERSGPGSAPPMPEALVRRLRGRRRVRAARRAGAAAVLALVAAPLAWLWRAAPAAIEPPSTVRLTVGPTLQELRRANADADPASLVLPAPEGWSDGPSVDTPLRAGDTLRAGRNGVSL